MTANLISLVSAVIALLGGAILFWQAISAWRQARSAIDSAAFAARSASAAERQALAAERQAEILEEQKVVKRTARAAQQDIIAVASVSPILRAVRAEIARFDVRGGAPSEALLQALESMQDETAAASDIAFSAELRNSLDALRGQAEMTSEIRGIARWVPAVSNVPGGPQHEEEVLRRADALNGLDNSILAFLKDRSDEDELNPKRRS